MTQTINKYADTMLNKISQCIAEETKNLPTLSGAKVSSVNTDGTINVYFPPDDTKIFTNISNQTPFNLQVGDSVELLLKDGSYNNCWIVAKHQDTFTGKFSNSEDTENLVSTTEIDPVFASSPAYLITEADISKWDSATSVFPSSTVPKMDGTATVGTETSYARGDHIHPTDTTRQAKITASGILKGDGNGAVTSAVAGTDYQAPLPSQTGNTGKFLTTNGSALSWQTVDALPSQSGNTGKFLTTNGSSASWAEVDVPTKTSELTNDSNFVSDANYVHTDNNFTGTLKTKLEGIAEGAEVNQNAFSNVKVGTSTIAADTKTDTLTLTAGSNITLTPDTTNDAVTIAATVPTKVSDLTNDSNFVSDASYVHTDNNFTTTLKNKLDGTSNRNLLDNWYFVGGGSQQGGGQFPINQRGQTSYSRVGYTVDRWRTSNTYGTLTIRSNYITFSNTSSSNTASLYQDINAIPAGTYTLSARVKSGTVVIGYYLPSENLYYTRTFTVGDTWTIVSQTFTSPEEVTRVIIRRSAGVAGVDIAAVKLELGTVSTLANDAPPDFGEELRKCQRYFVRLLSASAAGYMGVAYATGGGASAQGIINLPVPLRTPPSISVSSCALINMATGSYAASISSASFHSLIGTCLGLNLSMNVTPSQGVYVIYGDTSCYIDISAEL